MNLGGYRGRAGARSTLLSSVTALVFSVFSLYETVIKQADLRVYQPPLIYMYRENFRDVFAIPITLSNVGTQHGTVLSFDLEVTHPVTLKRIKFQSLYFGVSPKRNARLFTPITIAGRSSYTDVILFYALSRGSFVEVTGGVKLPLRFKLTLNMDTTGPTFRRSGMEFLRNFFCIVYNRLAFTGRFGINEALGFFLPGS